MKTKSIILFLFFLFISINCFAAEDLSHITEAGGTIFFAWDGESQSFSADAGSGRFTHLGGNINGPAGTGCSDTAIYHNTIISSDPAGQSAVPGSKYSLKTPYNGACNNESYTRDTTTIDLDSNKKEIYIRWYQKFTNTWQSGSRHKFTKFTQLGYTDDGHATGYSTFQGPANVISQDIYNVPGQFGANKFRLHAVDPGYSATFADNFNNGFSNFPLCTGNDANFVFQTDTWYCMEMHVKMNSNSSTNDAEYDLWIDGHKYMSLRNFRWYGTTTIEGIGHFELQHLQQNRDANDEPTYMDNIVIADHYIGPFGATASQTPDIVKDFSKEH